MKHFVTSAIVLMFLLSSPALASIGKGNSEVGVDFGFVNVDDSGPVLGMRGGYHFTDLFQLEGQFSTFSFDDDVLGFGIDGDVRTIMVNGVFNFHPRPNIVPYALIGIGSTEVEMDIFGFQIDDSATSIRYGGGARFFLGQNKKVSIRAEVSRMSVDTFDDESTQTTVLGSLSWKLGG